MTIIEAPTSAKTATYNMASPSKPKARNMPLTKSDRRCSVGLGNAFEILAIGLSPLLRSQADF
ncbi:MAG: hypothetical protein ACE5H6_05410 [Dehalococcoidia bacterium]